MANPDKPTGETVVVPSLAADAQVVTPDPSPKAKNFVRTDGGYTTNFVVEDVPMITPDGVYLTNAQLRKTLEMADHCSVGIVVDSGEK